MALVISYSFPPTLWQQFGKRPFLFQVRSSQFIYRAHVKTPNVYQGALQRTLRYSEIKAVM